MTPRLIGRLTQDDDGRELATLIKEIDDHGWDLSLWEEGFIEDVRAQDSWTERQAEVITRIHGERV